MGCAAVLREAVGCLSCRRFRDPAPVEEFKECCQLVAIKRAGGHIDDDDFWNLYGYFKQTVVGDYNIKDTSEANATELRKWASWKKRQGMSKKDAMRAYIAIVRDLFGGPDERSTGYNSVTAAYSRHRLRDDASARCADDGLFTLVVDNRLTELETLLRGKFKPRMRPSIINAKTPEGLTALHLAADRGHVGIVKCLIKHGADINAVDDNHDTALLVAVAAGHRPVVEVLLRLGADSSIRNIDDVCATDVIKDGSSTKSAMS